MKPLRPQLAALTGISARHLLLDDASDIPPHLQRTLRHARHLLIRLPIHQVSRVPNDKNVWLPGNGAVRPYLNATAGPQLRTKSGNDR
jgi:hypothetical protein